MFICDECLERDFNNFNWGFYSNGKCEICSLKKPCSDIPSSKLVRKDAEKEESNE